MYFNLFNKVFNICVLIICISDVTRAYVPLKPNINLPICDFNGTLLNKTSTRCEEITGFNCSHIEIFRNNDDEFTEWKNVHITFYHHDIRKKGKGVVSLDPDVEEDAWIILEDGTVHLLNYSEDDNTININNYCIEISRLNEDNFIVRILFHEIEFQRNYIGGILKFIQAICLIGLAVCTRMYELYDGVVYFVTFCVTTAIYYIFMALTNMIEFCTLNNCNTIREIEYCLAVLYHLWILFFCIKLKNISENGKSVCGIPWSINYKTYHIISLSYLIVMIILYSITSTHLHKKHYIEISFYYIPIGLMNSLSFILGIYLLMVILTASNQHFGTREIHREEKMFYRSCVFIFLIPFLIYIFKVVLYILQIKLKTSQSVELVLLDILVNLFGIIVTLAFFKKTWIDYTKIICYSYWSKNMFRRVPETETEQKT